MPRVPATSNRWVAFGLVALLALAAWAVFRPPSIDRSRVYRIGYGEDAPMHFKDAKGQPDGLAVQLVREAARRSDIKLEWVQGEGVNFQGSGLDMWVLLTILPERLQTMHFSEPYLQTQSCLLVRADSPFREMSDLVRARVSYNQAIMVRDALAKLLPDCDKVPQPSSDAALAALNEGTVDAALVDEYLVIRESLEGRRHVPFRLLPTRSAKRFMAIGSSFATAPVADELRRTMQVMADAGELTPLINRWTFFAPVTGTIDELAAARRRERWLALGLSALLLITALTVGLALRSHRQADKLRRTENFLREIADRVPGVVYQYRLNADGTAALPYASEALRQIYRLNPEAVRTNVAPIFAAMHPDDRVAVQASIQRSARELTPWVHEYRICFPDGTVRWLVGNAAAPHREPDGAVVWHGVITDVTERKAAEANLQAFERKLQETQRLESLGVLAGGIAHDFNNLLTGILGNANLASLEAPPESPLRAHLEPIKRGALRAAELCKQLLAYSGKGRFVVGKVDLHALLDETTELLRHSISKQCELRFNRAAHLPPMEGDATQLRQVIMNLVINASEALGTANGTITLSTRLVTLPPGESPAGTFLCLEVSDNGCGMSAETLKKIFDPFFTTKFTGRGLGLAAVHGIVRGHRGVLQVESEAGRGTTFRLLFPPTEGTADPVASPRAGGDTWRGAGCVLVVDDEEPVRQVAAAMLRKLGFECVLAIDGRQAVEEFRANPDRFILVLLDLTMPQLDGKQVYRELRQLREGVRVVLMSGFNEEQVVTDFAGGKISGFLQKPFDYDTFCAVVRRATAPGAS